jgi:hypothetical protein
MKGAEIITTNKILPKTGWLVKNLEKKLFMSCSNNNNSRNKEQTKIYFLYTRKI